MFCNRKLLANTNQYNINITGRKIAKLTELKSIGLGNFQLWDTKWHFTRISENKYWKLKAIIGQQNHYFVIAILFFCSERTDINILSN